MRKLTYSLGIVAGIVVASAFLLLPMQTPSRAYAQVNPTFDPPNNASASSPPQASYAPGSPFPPSFGSQPSTTTRWAQNTPTRLSKEEIEEQKLLVELLKRIRSNEKDEKAAEARTELKDLLSSQLDRDLAKREESLEEIERRAAELRTQLETRRNNKEQTLEILMMLAENPAAGLGIPPQWMQSFGIETNNRFPSPYRQPMPAQTPNPFGDARRPSANSDPFSASPNAADPFGN